MPFSARPFPVLIRAFLLACGLCIPIHAAETPYRYPEGPAPADETVAYAWLAGATVIPVTAALLVGGNSGWSVPASLLFAAGSLAGPSAGEFYAGSPGRALGAIAARAIGEAVFVVGALRDCLGCSQQVAEGPESGVEGDGEDGRIRDDDGLWLMIAGGALFCLGTAFSVADTHFAVRRNHITTTGRKAEVSPTLHFTPDGGLACGARVSRRF